MKKRLFALLMAVVMMMAMSPVVHAADSAIGSTLRLEKTEGTVTIENKNGKTISVRDGVKLYDGYTITTGAASYAYISLDGTKVVKLDANASAEVRQSGKQLEIDLHTGSLLFNVTKPLEGDETFNIRTSTMVTGIRGTSGIVTARGGGARGGGEGRQEKTSILTGSVTVTTQDENGEKNKRTLDAGKQLGATLGGATGQTPDPAKPTLTPELKESEIDPDEIPGFVATEIEKDTELKEAIRQQTKLDVDKIAENAEKKLQEDEKKAEEERIQREKEEAAEAARLALLAGIIDPAFGTPKPTSTSGGTVVVPPPMIVHSPSPSPSARETTISGTALTEADILNALSAGYNKVVVDASSRITITNSIAIPPGATLVVAGVIVIASGQHLANHSATTFILESTGTLQGDGNLYNGPDPESNDQTATGRMELHGRVELTSGGIRNVRGSILIGASAVIECQDMQFEDVNGSVTIKNGSTVTTNNLYSFGTMVIESSAVVVERTMHNDAGGNMEIKSGAYVQAAQFSNYGTLKHDGSLGITSSNDEGGFDTRGTATITGSINSTNGFEGALVTVDAGSVTFKNGASLYDDSPMNTSEPIINQLGGTVTLENVNFDFTGDNAMKMRRVVVVGGGNLSTLNIVHTGGEAHTVLKNNSSNAVIEVTGAVSNPNINISGKVDIALESPGTYLNMGHAIKFNPGVGGVLNVQANSAVNIDGIYAAAGTVNLDAGKVKKGGAALYIEDATVNINNAEVVGGDEGGNAIYVYGGGKFIINNAGAKVHTSGNEVIYFNMNATNAEASAINSGRIYSTNTSAPGGLISYEDDSLSGKMTFTGGFVHYSNIGPSAEGLMADLFTIAPALDCWDFRLVAGAVSESMFCKVEDVYRNSGVSLLGPDSNSSRITNTDTGSLTFIDDASVEIPSMTISSGTVTLIAAGMSAKRFTVKAGATITLSGSGVLAFDVKAYDEGSFYLQRLEFADDNAKIVFTGTAAIPLQLTNVSIDLKPNNAQGKIVGSSSTRAIQMLGSAGQEVRDRNGKFLGFTGTPFWHGWDTSSPFNDGTGMVLE